jgi:hypothetical protein
MRDMAALKDFGVMNARGSRSRVIPGTVFYSSIPVL